MRKWRKWLMGLFLTILLSLLGVPAQADGAISASLTTEQDALHVGDRIVLTLRITHPAGHRVVAVPIGQTATGPSTGSTQITWGTFEVWSQSALEVTSNDDGTETSTQIIEGTLWTPGSHATPPLPVTLADSTGNSVAVTVEPISLRLNSVLVEGETELRDLKPQATWTLLPAWLRWAGWALVAVAVPVGVGWFHRRWLVYRRRRPGMEPDARSASQIALDELAEIEALNLPVQGRFKEQYTLVTDVLRRWLATHYQIPALDQTTAEIREALRPVVLPQLKENRLWALLHEADLVKFANLVPDREMAASLPEQARQIILAVQAAGETKTTDSTADRQMATRPKRVMA